MAHVFQSQVPLQIHHRAGPPPNSVLPLTARRCATRFGAEVALNLLGQDIDEAPDEPSSPSFFGEANIGTQRLVLVER